MFMNLPSPSSWCRSNMHDVRHNAIVMISPSHSKAATHCKTDVYNFAEFPVAAINFGIERLIPRQFGSQRVVDPGVPGRSEPAAALANRLSNPFDSPQRLSGSNAPATARSAGFS